MDEKIDLISGLPETILHDILSRLPKKDATKTCVLSRKWKEILYTFPILSICDKDSIKKLSKQMEDEQIKTFIDHGKQGFLRFSDQGLAIKEFRLILTLTWFDHRVMYPDIDQWLKLATQCGVQNLKFFLPTLEKGDQHRCYLLHPSAIESRSLD
ncbi:hypothetical protein PIB30_103659, partial [Stylosanthes scabra]|nr:hypothetical protein [Stylosanthes scabra]